MNTYVRSTTVKTILFCVRNYAKQDSCTNYISSRKLTSCINLKYILFKKIDFLSNYSTKFYFKSSTRTIEDSVKDILSENNLNNLDTNNDIVKILSFLLSKGYSPESIKEKCLNHLSFTNTSFLKVKQIEELDPDILSLMPFMSLSDSALRKAVLQAREDKSAIKDFTSRIAYLCHHLEISTEDLIPALTKHTSLLTMKFNRLSHKMSILKDAEISCNDLVKDLWIFNYNETLLLNRITAAEKEGVKLKPWMLRCSENFFSSLLTKYSETNRILDGNDVFRYLSKRLDCSEEYVKLMMERNKNLNKINIPKLEQLIDFLLEKGYTLQEIRLFPKVFSTKVETLDERIKLYRPYHNTLPTMSELCVSSKKLQETLNKHK